jgi:hypothetical protein
MALVRWRFEPGAGALGLDFGRDSPCLSPCLEMLARSDFPRHRRLRVEALKGEDQWG